MRGDHLAPADRRVLAEDRLIEPLIVHRSTLRTWLISLAAIPAIVIGVDVLWRRRIVAWLTEAIFDTDPQTLEARDEIWAWTMVVVGAAVVAWGLKELFFPAPILRTDEEGIHLRVGGPLKPPTTLPWGSLYDIDAGTLEDDEEEMDVLVIEVKEPSLLPHNPWAGRRVDDRTMALFTAEWDADAEQIAALIADQALAIARLLPAEE
jgi:hypothetical protein